MRGLVLLSKCSCAVVREASPRMAHLWPRSLVLARDLDQITLCSLWERCPTVPQRSSKNEEVSMEAQLSRTKLGSGGPFSPTVSKLKPQLLGINVNTDERCLPARPRCQT